MFQLAVSLFTDKINHLSKWKTRSKNHAFLQVFGRKRQGHDVFILLSTRNSAERGFKRKTV